MHQLLKLLDDNSCVYRYKTCDDGVTIRDIFYTHPNSIKLFITFSTMLILDSTYKTNKYRLPLFEMIGVTSTEKTYYVGFAFLECEKKDNFTWSLEVCRSLLKDQSEIPKAIVTDPDITLMNSTAKVFPSSYALRCKYHIIKNVRSRVKPAVGTKPIKSEGGKLVKAGVIVEKLMDAWNHNTLYSHLVDNISRARLNYIFHEAKRADNVGSDSVKYGCTTVKTYGLPCACTLPKKVKLGEPIRMDEVCFHWRRLMFDDDG
ncbi:unnamed protein product [Lathyrus sativus]|nr:unnamed protein product [Lathyrus sativus]